VRLRRAGSTIEIQATPGAQASVLATKATTEQAEREVESTRVTSLVTGIAGQDGIVGTFVSLLPTTSE